MAKTSQESGMTEEGECLCSECKPTMTFSQILTPETSRGTKSCWFYSVVWKDGICFPYKQLHSRMSNQVCYLYSARKCSYVCPIGEIKKLEIEIWNLKVKGTDMVSYNQHFQELSLMCSRMFVEESDEIKKYVGGLPDMIHGSVMASKPKTMQDAIEFATELMD
ncbi:hypothetical protein Tco_1285773 [Tanacetum coccineum]